MPVGISDFRVSQEVELGRPQRESSDFALACRIGSWRAGPDTGRPGRHSDQAFPGEPVIHLFGRAIQGQFNRSCRMRMIDPGSRFGCGPVGRLQASSRPACFHRGQGFRLHAYTIARIETVLRRAAARTVHALAAVIAPAIAAFTPDGCANDFANADGYELDSTEPALANAEQSRRTARPIWRSAARTFPDASPVLRAHRSSCVRRASDPAP